MQKAKRTDKKKDKSFIIIISVVVFLAVFTILSVILYDPVMALVELSNVKKFNTKDEIISVVYADPMRGTDQTFSNYEVILTDKDADEASAYLNTLMKNVKYKRTDKKDLGEWKQRIVLCNDTQNRTIYLGESSIYLKKGSVLIEYAIDSSEIDNYTVFLKKLNQL